MLNANAILNKETARLLVGADISDELLELLINQISGGIESQLGRKLALGRYQERCAADGTQFLVLREYPITQVYSVTQNGAVLDPASYDSDLQGDIGVLYKDDGWMYDGYPAGLAGDYVMPSRRIVVDYEAGYVLPPVATEDEPSTLPGDLERLACEMLQDIVGRLSNGGNSGLRSFSISDVRWEWSTEIPQSWLETIRRHRRLC